MEIRLPFEQACLARFSQRCRVEYPDLFNTKFSGNFGQALNTGVSGDAYQFQVIRICAQDAKGTFPDRPAGTE